MTMLTGRVWEVSLSMNRSLLNWVHFYSHTSLIKLATRFKDQSKPTYSGRNYVHK